MTPHDIIETFRKKANIKTSQLQSSSSSRGGITSSMGFAIPVSLAVSPLFSIHLFSFPTPFVIPKHLSLSQQMTHECITANNPIYILE